MMRRRRDSGSVDRMKQEIFSRVRKYFENFHGPSVFIPGKTRIQYACRMYDSREMVNMTDAVLDFWLTAGPYAQKFERRLKKYFDAESVVLVNSGSSANLVMVAALKSKQVRRPLSEGDEVIVPAVAFPTTVAPVIQNGLKPVFVDCDVGTYTMNPELLRKAVSKKTRAVFILHTLGNPCDMDSIMRIAGEHGLIVLEDACNTFGASFGGKKTGTFGCMASLSFYAAHHITTGEGGAVVVNDPSLRKPVVSVRDWGRDCWCDTGESGACGRRFKWHFPGLPPGYDHKYVYSHLGYNLKLTDLQAACGLAQMDKVDYFREKRERNFRAYYEGLRKLQKYLVLPVMHPRSSCSWFGFPVTVKKGIVRSELVAWLEKANIETRCVFGGNITRQPAFRNLGQARIPASLRGADRIMRDSFFIGVHPGLTGEMIRFVISRFESFFRSKK